MLVLSRYKDQSIYIGDDIVVTIVDVRGDRIRLGVEAPANVPVHRQEIYEQIQQEKDSGDRGNLCAKYRVEVTPQEGCRQRRPQQFVDTVIAKERKEEPEPTRSSKAPLSGRKTARVHAKPVKEDRESYQEIDMSRR